MWLCPIGVVFIGGQIAGAYAFAMSWISEDLLDDLNKPNFLQNKPTLTHEHRACSRFVCIPVKCPAFREIQVQRNAIFICMLCIGFTMRALFHWLDMFFLF